LTQLKDERDILTWQVGKLAQGVFTRQTQIDSQEGEISQMRASIKAAKDREASLLSEIS
jgi:outer membrane murein-binding lipoprotein Lpp